MDKESLALSPNCEDGRHSYLPLMSPDRYAELPLGVPTQKWGPDQHHRCWDCACECHQYTEWLSRLPNNVQDFLKQLIEESWI